jgi:hypothetical protein
VANEFKVRNGLITPNLLLTGSSSGSTTIRAAATTSSSYTWPAAVPGTSGYVLSSDTGGVLSWIAQSGGASSGQFRANIGSWTSGATAVINVNTVDQYNITGLSTDITISVTSTVTPNDGQRLLIRIRDNAIARNLTWTQTANQFRFIGISPPTITSVSKLIYIGCVYNAADGYWDLISSLTQP